MQNLRMPDINCVLIAGNLTKDPIFRRTTNGTPVANFWIASNRRFKDNNGQWRENVCYVGVVAWYKLAENCAANLHKGNAVIIEGELQSRSFKLDDGRNRNIVEIKARRVQFLNKKDEGIEESEAESPVEKANETDETPFDREAPDLIKEGVSAEETGIPGQDNEKAVSDTREVNEIDSGDELSGDYDFGYQNLEI